MNISNNQPDSISISRKFAKNSLFNVAGFIVTFPILILLTPYMLEVLGKARFGIWAIAGVVTSYAQLSDMGMTTAIVKFVAEHWAKKEVNRISEVVSTAFFSFSVVGGIVAAALLLARHFIVINLLKVPPDMQPEALFVVSGIVIIFYFNLLFSVYNSVLLGLQRMDVTNYVMVVSKVLRALGMWAFLAAGLGLKGLILNGAIFSALAIGANVFWAKRLTEGLRVVPFWVSFTELRRVVKYSANIFFARLISLGQNPINKIILAAYTSLPFVSFYEVGWRVTQMVRQFFQVGLAPLLPASSELHSVTNKRELERIYFSISRMLYLFALPVFLFVVVFAEALAQVWLGDGYTLAARAIQFLLIGNLFSLLVTPQYIILQGIGKPKINTIAHAIAAVINVVLAILLVQYVGFLGILIAGVISLLISSIFIDCLFRKIVGINLRAYLRQISTVSNIVLVLLGGCLVYIFRFVNSWNFTKVFLLAICFFLIYVAIIKFARVINESDIELLRRFFTEVKVPR